MKKVIPILFMFVLMYSLTHVSELVIPTDAIRFRVIASSDNSEDQLKKIMVRDAVEELLNEEMSSSKSSSDAYQNLENSLPKIKDTVNKYTSNYHLSLGENYFPTKEYKGITYPSGNYRSLVITLGNGNGHNWWCVMYPPLCLLESKKTNTSDVEYRSFFKDILTHYQA